MDYLPRDILSSILSMLPVKSILRFRAVSKFWLKIIDDPSFRNSYEVKDCIALGFSDEFRKSGPTFHVMMTDGRSVEAKEMARAEELRDYCFGNCCHGLFYFKNIDWNGQSAVFNPLTREVLKLPEMPWWSCYSRTHRVLGFDPSTGTFKLVQLFFEDLITSNVEAATYNFKTQCWARCKAHQFPSVAIIPYINTSHVHATDTGTVYWHIGGNCVYEPGNDLPKRWPDGSYGQVILSFDMEKEEFQSTWFPKRVYSVHITELDGRLAVCSYGVKYINIYELVDYQSQNWVKRYRIPRPPPETSVKLSSYCKKKMLLAYPLSKDAYPPSKDETPMKRFYLYDLENNKWTNLGEGRFDRSFQVYCTKPYLISLKGS